MTCIGSVVVGLTASPVNLDKGVTAQKMLKLIKGEEYKNNSNEGFVSYFNNLHPSMYPQVKTGDPTVCFPNIYWIKLFDKNLYTYNEKYKSNKGAPNKTYLNMGVGSYTTNDAFKQVIKNHSVKQFGEIHKSANKLWNIANHVKKYVNLGKTLILMPSNGGGLQVMSDILSKFKISNVVLSGKGDDKVKDSENLSKFKDENNVDGLEIQVAIANEDKYSEGEDFPDVRRLVIVNPPKTVSRYIQMVGRPIRACGLNRVVFIDMFVAIHPSVHNHPSDSHHTEDENNVIHLQKELKKFSKEMNILREASVDGYRYGQGALVQSCRKPVNLMLKHSRLLKTDFNHPKNGNKQRPITIDRTKAKFILSDHEEIELSDLRKMLKRSGIPKLNTLSKKEIVKKVQSHINEKMAEAKKGKARNIRYSVLENNTKIIEDGDLFQLHKLAKQARMTVSHRITESKLRRKLRAALKTKEMRDMYN